MTYARQLTIHAARGQVFRAIATLEGLRCWWTTIVTGSADPGGKLHFRLASRGPQACDLDFRHMGIDQELVTEGWGHFLTSLTAYTEHGQGHPFGAEAPVRCPAKRPGLPVEGGRGNRAVAPG